MTADARTMVKDMFTLQENLLQTYIEGNDGDYESKNAKALLHELVEYEKGFAWKPWKNGVDAKLKDHLDTIPDGEDPTRPLTEEEAVEYRKEELIDMLHFIIQECIETGAVDFVEAATILEKGKDNIDEEMYETFDGTERDYHANRLRSNASNHKEAVDNFFVRHMLKHLSELMARDFDNVQEIYEWFGDKNEENHDRAEGESEGREEYQLTEDDESFFDADIESYDEGRFEVVEEGDAKEHDFTIIDHETGDREKLEEMSDDDLDQLSSEFFDEKNMSRPEDVLNN